MQNTTEELTLEEAKRIITDLQAKIASRRPNPSALGFHIRKRRIEAGISQHAMQAAGVIGICNIERLGRDITTRTLVRVANVLKCPAWQIVKDWEEACQSACESASGGQDVSDAKPNLP